MGNEMSEIPHSFLGRGRAWCEAGHGGGGAWGGGCMEHLRASHKAERSLIRQALGAAADLAEGAGAIGAARARSLARRKCVHVSCSAKLMWVSPYGYAYRTQLH